MTRNKPRISATIEETLKEQLDNKNINVSQLIESLLKEYLAHGESTTVALKLRRKELQQKKQNKQIQKQRVENEIESLDNQIDELTAKIRERREAGLDGVGDIVEKVQSNEMSAEYIHENNPIIKENASQAGVPAREYAKAVKDELEAEA